MTHTSLPPTMHVRTGNRPASSKEQMRGWNVEINASVMLHRP
jgi:hypothetical protein